MLSFSELSAKIDSYRNDNEELINSYHTIIESNCFKPFRYNKRSNRGGNHYNNRGGKYNNHYNSRNTRGNDSSRKSTQGKYQFTSSRRSRQSQHSGGGSISVIKRLMNNSDKMINEFNKCINKLTDNNYDIIYKDVVSLFTNYIGNIITDYIESYIKFGIDGKHNIQSLNMSLINEKYCHYQGELWKLLLNKIILTNNILYYKFARHLCIFDSKEFNISLISNIKNIFKKYSDYNYDKIQLEDEIDDEDPEQFFKGYITDISQKDQMIYNKIKEIIKVFQDYDFNLSIILNKDIQFNESIIMYLGNTETREEHKTDIEFIENCISKGKANMIGTILAFHIINEKKWKEYILTVMTKLCKEELEINHKNGEIILGIFEYSDIFTIYNKNEKEEIKTNLLFISKKLPSMIKYKMLDVIESI